MEYMKNLYPKISNVKRSNKVINILNIISIVISIILIIINYLINKEILWSLICILGIIYVWITTIYSIKKNVNIGSHVIIQVICISALVLGIDYIISYKGWSLKIAIPIILIVANVTMLLLTIVSHKRYYKYALNQIKIFIITAIILLIPVIKLIKFNILYMILAIIALISLILAFTLCGRDLISEIKKKFHI